ncbi:alpha-ketoglutarate-dependent dioxygenase AlkB family protein [Pokkaliibacter sp. CJK22405]|uniref:alpha-ketoglutarate-dependent dioxygenase AlkB family protein n=1 Tax=Pokkaliibacter sp. CJK22405 TaxID=3384615 RepID=UPI00398484B3
MTTQSESLWHLFPDWLPAERADQLLLTLCSELAWQQPSIQLYGKIHPIPRLQVWMGDSDSQYRYSGKYFEPEPWHHEIVKIRQYIAEQTGWLANSVLINLYRNGEDKMGWHSDDEPELGPEPRILSLSLGASREMALRKKGQTRTSHLISLNHGDLVEMLPGCQTHWQHSIPPRKRVTTPRINLTFRQINPQ